MDKIIGNYLSQANKSFPVDCETLDYIAGNATLAEMLGNIAGDKVILYGCDAVNGSASRKDGYVFIRTEDYPEGEVLRFEGGPTANGLHVVKDDVAVSANGYSFPKAYTARYLAAGYGSEQYKWEDFEEVKTNRSLWEALSGLQKAFSEFSAEPLGIVKMWAGQRVPDGYHLCDGSQLLITAYPALFDAIGTTFNSAKNADGIPVTTDAGYFRLPDLRGRFIVGYHDADDDYKMYGTVGGEKQHLLKSTESGVGEHGHSGSISGGEHEHGIVGTASWDDDGNAGGAIVTGNKELSENQTFNAKAIGGSHSHALSIAEVSEDASQAHENRPPYYVLAYIMKLE